MGIGENAKGYGGSRKNAWLLIKHRDEYASKKDITQEAPNSVVSRRSLAGIARDGGGDVEKAASGDPPDETARTGEGRGI